MPLFGRARKSMRESAFQLARRDLALFLQDHEDELLCVFRDELKRLDDEIPEESFFIDINMVGLGETFLLAALRAISRFLTEDVSVEAAERATPVDGIIDPPADE